MRSQDKTTLSKIVNFKVERTQILGNTKNDDWYVYLGTYKTKERALEVLDEIQNILKPKVFIEPIKVDKMLESGLNDLVLHTENVSKIEQLDTYVYEMQKE